MNKPEPLNCETCGAEVTVVGHTTKHYEPVFTREKVDGLLRALEFYADEENWQNPMSALQEKRKSELLLADYGGKNSGGGRARLAIAEFEKGK
jgi:hypothetical protein